MCETREKLCVCVTLSAYDEVVLSSCWCRTHGDTRKFSVERLWIRPQQLAPMIVNVLHTSSTSSEAALPAPTLLRGAVF